MAESNEQPVSANKLINDLMNVLKPVNHADSVREMARAEGRGDIEVPEDVGLVIGLVDQVDKRQYVKIRDRLNDAFMVGDYPKFKGYVEEDTEFGDITDTFHIIFEEQFNRPFRDGEMVSYEVRLKWRDALLKELDEMVER